MSYIDTLDKISESQSSYWMDINQTQKTMCFSILLRKFLEKVKLHREKINKRLIEARVYKAYKRIS